MTSGGNNAVGIDNWGMNRFTVSIKGKRGIGINVGIGKWPKSICSLLVSNEPIPTDKPAQIDIESAVPRDNIWS